MARDNGGVDRLRILFAWIILGVWVLSFIGAAVKRVDSSGVAGAQAMMLIVAGWLFWRGSNGKGSGDD